jgi:hypothetical protein
MSTLPTTGATELTSGQAVPETAVNAALRALDANASRAIIEDRDLTAPPGSCGDGASYLVAASPTGAWAGQAGKMATAIGTNAANGWRFQTVAVEGYRLYVRDENVELHYDGAWVLITTPVEATSSQMWAGTTSAAVVTPKKIFDAAAEITLTDGATITPDFNTGLNFKVTLGGNRTLANPTNAKEGQSGVIVVTQDGTGSRTLSYGTNWKFPGGSASSGVISTAAGSVDLIAYFVRAGGTILCNLSKAYS